MSQYLPAINPATTLLALCTSELTEEASAGTMTTPPLELAAGGTVIEAGAFDTDGDDEETWPEGAGEDTDTAVVDDGFGTATGIDSPKLDDGSVVRPDDAVTAPGVDDDAGRVIDINPLKDSPKDETDMLALPALLNVLPPVDEEPRPDAAATGDESCRLAIHGSCA